MLSLSTGRLGRPYTVYAVRAADEVKTRLENLGVLPGAEVMLLLRRAGDVVVKIKDTRLALNRRVAVGISIF